MKILLLCKKLPFLANDGETIVIDSYAEALRQLGCDIHLLAMNTSRHFYEVTEKDLDNSNYKSITIVKVDNSISVKGAIQQLAKNKSYHISRFRSKEYESSLESILKKYKFDIIQIESLFLCSYIPKIRVHFNGPVCMRSHNLEYRIWESLARAETNPLKKSYLSILAKQLKTYEIAQFDIYDHLFCLSKDDLQGFVQLGFQNEASIIEIGLKMSNYNPKKGHANQIGFIGSLDWQPNKNALLWFINKVWPKLNADSNLKLAIAGRNTPEEIYALASDKIKVLGEVNDALTFINEQHIFIAPILEGSGVRVKILEAMAMGKAVVSTSMGAMGIQAKDQREFSIADTSSEFAEAILKLHHNPLQVESLGQSARKFCLAHHDHLTIGRKMMEQYQTILKK